MPMRIAIGRIVIIAQPLSRGWFMVEAFEADDAENLTLLAGFPPRKMTVESLLDQLADIASEAEEARLEAAAKRDAVTKPQRAFGVFRGSVQIDGRFDEPLPDDELARWEGEASMGRIERLARSVAVKGRTEAERLLSIATRAVELLDDPRLEKSIAFAREEAQAAHFAWEDDNEQFPPGAPVSIYLASSDDYLTGEGVTLYFGAGYGRSENEFRRTLATEWGSDLAERARVDRGADAEVPFSDLFVSPALRTALHKMGQRDDEPGAFSFFSRQHTHYS